MAHYLIWCDKGAPNEWDFIRHASAKEIKASDSVPPDYAGVADRDNNKLFDILMILQYF